MSSLALLKRDFLAFIQTKYCIHIDSHDENDKERETMVAHHARLILDWTSCRRRDFSGLWESKYLVQNNMLWLFGHMTTHRVHSVQLFLLDDTAVIERDGEVRVVKHVRHSDEPDLKEA